MGTDWLSASGPACPASPCQARCAPFSNPPGIHLRRGARYGHLQAPSASRRRHRPRGHGRGQKADRLVQRQGHGALRDRGRRWSAAAPTTPHKVAITDATMAKAQAADAVIFGAVGGPKWDRVAYDVRPEAGLLRLRKDLALYANLRPAMSYPALADASSLKRELVEGLDIMILRELTGGVYFGEPKTITDLGNGQKRARRYPGLRHLRDRAHRARRLRAGAQAAQQGHLDGEAQRHEDGRALERGGRRGAQARIQGRAARAHAGRRRRHAARAQSQAVRRDRHRQSVRRHAVRRRRHAHRLARHAGVGLARRGRSEDAQAQGDVRAGARLGARHRRQGRSPTRSR